MIVDDEKEIERIHQEQNLEELEQKVLEVVDADTPPAQALGDTTDYRQVVIAWGKKHGLTLEELLPKLEERGGAEAQQLAARIRSEPDMAEAFRTALAMPFEGKTQADLIQEQTAAPAK